MINKFQPQGKTKTVVGSVLNPEMGGLCFVLSVNTMLGKTDHPIYGVLNRKWKQIQTESKGWYSNKNGSYKLGAINTTAVQSDVWVIHMLCLDETGKVNIDGLNQCLNNTLKLAKSEKASVHVSEVLFTDLPAWKEMLQQHFVANGINVLFYTDTKNS